jgi:mono/diheme cytochrome c family protein
VRGAAKAGATALTGALAMTHALAVTRRLAVTRALVLTGALALMGTLVLALSGPAHAADTPLSPLQEQGQKLFRNNCFYCHTEKVWGTLSLERRRPGGDALLEKRTDLTPEFVKSVVRNGLGSMPAYRRTELTDADVDAIIAYLTRNRSATAARSPQP